MRASPRRRTRRIRCEGVLFHPGALNPRHGASARAQPVRPFREAFVCIACMSVCVFTLCIHGWMKVKATTERFEFHVFIPPWKPRAWTSTRSGQGACRGAGKRMRGFGEPGCEQCSQQGVNPGSRGLGFGARGVCQAQTRKSKRADRPLDIARATRQYGSGENSAEKGVCVLCARVRTKYVIQHRTGQVAVNDYK